MQIEVFIVIQEDEYETRFGDGYHAYFMDVFESRTEADAFVKGASISLRPKTANSGYRYHVRPAHLIRDAVGQWSMIAAEPSPLERLDVNRDGVATDWATFASTRS